MKKSTAVFLLLYCFWSGTAFGSSVTKTGVETCTSFTPTKMINAVSRAAELTGVSMETLAAVSIVESRFGKLKGIRGGAVYAKSSRDLVPLIVIAEMFGYAPEEVCVSKASPGGFGSAMGPGQILPSMWAAITGMEFEPLSREYFPSVRWSLQNVKLLQAVLNHVYGLDLKVDGFLGPNTAKHLRTFQDDHVAWGNGLCSRESQRASFGRCTKVAVAKFVNWVYQYNPEKDRVSGLLGRRSDHPPNPFDPLHSMIGMGILLSDLGVQRNFEYAIGAYFAGPTRAESSGALEYLRKVSGVREKVHQILQEFQS